MNARTTNFVEQSRFIAAVVSAFALPISTSIFGISVSILAVLTLSRLRRNRLEMVLKTPAGFLPIVLVVMMTAGVAWSSEAFGAAIAGVAPYAKLLLIPLLMASTVSAQQGLWIGRGFVAGCGIVLALSCASFVWPNGPWDFFKAPGVPFKDNAVQSACFVICAYGLGIAAARTWGQNRLHAAALAVVAALFFADVFAIFISKTGLLMAVALLALFLVHLGGWRRALLVAIPVTAFAMVLLLTSPSAQLRLKNIQQDIPSGGGSGESVSTASRIDFWRKGVEFLREAPIMGHGTGTIHSLYQREEALRPSPYGQATTDPHNQTLHVAIQLGAVGAALLIAMWLAQGLLFVGCSFPHLLGQALVLQQVIGSIFNSHLSGYTLGMLYCFVAGILGSMVISTNRSLTPLHSKEKVSRGERVSN